MLERYQYKAGSKDFPVVYFRTILEELKCNQITCYRSNRSIRCDFVCDHPQLLQLLQNELQCGIFQKQNGYVLVVNHTQLKKLLAKKLSRFYEDVFVVNPVSAPNFDAVKSLQENTGIKTEVKVTMKDNNWMQFVESVFNYLIVTDLASFKDFIKKTSLDKKESKQSPVVRRENQDFTKQLQEIHGLCSSVSNPIDRQYMEGIVETMLFDPFREPIRYLLEDFTSIVSGRNNNFILIDKGMQKLLMTMLKDEPVKASHFLENCLDQGHNRSDLAFARIITQLENLGCTQIKLFGDHAWGCGRLEFECKDVNQLKQVQALLKEVPYCQGHSYIVCFKKVKKLIDLLDNNDASKGESKMSAPTSQSGLFAVASSEPVPVYESKEEGYRKEIIFLIFELKKEADKSKKESREETIAFLLKLGIQSAINPSLSLAECINKLESEENHHFNKLYSTGCLGDRRLKKLFDRICHNTKKDSTALRV